MRNKRSPYKKILLWLSVAGLSAVTATASVFLYIASGLPPVEELQNRQFVESTKIYDRTGKILLYDIHGEERRTLIKSEFIPQYLKDAIISIEDSSFYTNPAFDWRGISRAIFVNLTRGRALQGGSTITQQLAKKSFLTDERTIIRKLKELVLASRLEKRYSKDEILTFYINQIPYGTNVYGIQAAAETFFNKNAIDLTLNESALLAALPNAPSYYSPWGSHVKELMSRKNLILDKMHEYGYIDKIQLDSSKASELEFAERSKLGIKAPHFVEYVESSLKKKYGEGLLKTGGLKVITSLDWELQQKAEESIKKGVERNKNLYGGANAALIANDPKTGQILAMVGSADYFDSENEGNFNVATQGLRQPGSTFKPFAYLTAFENGFTPDTILWDVQTEFNSTGEEEKNYRPENNDGIYKGPVTLKEALAESRNVPSVKVMYLAGVENTIRNAEKFGITTLEDRSRFGLSLVLGGGEVTLIELANAYGVFATEGIRNDIATILKIEDKNGAVLEEYKNTGERVVDPEYVRLLNDILYDVELRRGLFQNSIGLTKVPGYQIALKTGTSNDYVDAWTVGYAPNLIVGVWAGNNHREPLTSKAGSVLAAVPIWHDFISSALKKYAPETFKKPEHAQQAQNPLFRGELIKGDPHEILYHLNRLDDPQFKNWEDGVAEWLKTNSVDLNKFTVTDAASSGASREEAASGISINYISPKNGETIKDIVNIESQISSESPISKIEIYFNNSLIDTELENLGQSYFYRSPISPKSINPQNLLIIKVTDKNNFQAQKELILFH